MTDLPRPFDLIDGERREPTPLASEALADPNTGEPVQPVVQTSPEHVDKALAAAAAVRWSGATDIAARVELLTRFAEALEPRTEQIAVADALTSGVVISVTRMMAGSLPDVFRSAAEAIRAFPPVTDLTTDGRPVALHLLPWGPAAVLAPWNAPTLIAAKKLAFALAAGCPVVVKPSPYGPCGFSLVAEAALDALTATGTPPTLVQVVHGGAKTGERLAASPVIRALSLTGGRATGQAVATSGAADMKALQLELGSNNPVIVRADADIDHTADALVAGMTKLNGQWCEAPGSVFGPTRVLDQLRAAMLDRLASVRMGHCLDEASRLGPQGNSAQFTRFGSELERLQDAGAKIQTSTPLPDLAGYFAAPALAVDADPALTRNELFGPALTLHPVPDDAIALALANRCACGLAGYVFSSDVGAALALGAQLAGGEIKINGTSILDLSPHSTQAFWGGSGAGGHGDAELLRFFQGARIVGVDHAEAPL